MTELLHITNGSVALSRIHELGLPGRVVPWDDVLHEGPVPEGLSPGELRRVRAAFLSDTWDVSPAETERLLEARDRALGAEVDEIVLWFEHDLYDQLQVLQVLDVLAAHFQARPRSPRPRVSAILADGYLTAQSDDTLTAWFGRRRELRPEEWAAAAAAWTRFRAADPSGLDTFSHPGAWPTLTTALHRHCQQFPALVTGLSRTEAQSLAGLVGGGRSLRELFVAANHQVEAAVFMGDTTWWWHLHPLLAASHPLLRVEGAKPESLTHADWWRAADDAPRLALTDDGRRVLAGEADHVAMNGINRWLGGVHLHRLPGETTPVWRWHEATRSLAAH